MAAVPQRPSSQALDTNGSVSALEIASGTMILIIIALTMFFAFGSVTQRSALALCQADGSIVASAILNYDAHNPHSPLTNANYLQQLTGPLVPAGPFFERLAVELPPLRLHRRERYVVGLHRQYPH